MCQIIELEYLFIHWHFDSHIKSFLIDLSQIKSILELYFLFTKPKRQNSLSKLDDQNKDN